MALTETSHLRPIKQRPWLMKAKGTNSWMTHYAWRMKHRPTMRRLSIRYSAGMWMAKRFPIIEYGAIVEVRMAIPAA